MKLDISFVYDCLKLAWVAIPRLLLKGYSLPPLKMQFDITSQCNVSCYYCFQKERKISVPDLATSDIKRIIDKIPSTAVIIFGGGEPLVRKDFPEILVHATKRHKCALITNGLLIDQKIAKLLVENKVLNVGISLDGGEKTYNRIKGKNNYAKLINNIKLLQTEKKSSGKDWPRIDIKSTILKDNIAEIPTLYALAEELRADYFTVATVKLNSFQFNGNLEQNIPIAKANQKNVEKEALSEMYEKLWQLQKKYKTKLRSYPKITNKVHIENYYSQKALNMRYEKCIEPWVGGEINSQGELSPCISLYIGNLLGPDGFYNIWNSKKMKEFRNISKNSFLQVCEGCCYSVLKGHDVGANE